MGGLDNENRVSGVSIHYRPSESNRSEGLRTRGVPGSPVLLEILRGVGYQGRGPRPIQEACHFETSTFC